MFLLVYAISIIHFHTGVVMDSDLAFREARIGFKGVVILGVVSAAVYAAVSHYGMAATFGIAGLTIGYLVARCTKL